jgi:glycosyltransferase involved in cell wall biosynthesis
MPFDVSYLSIDSVQEGVGASQIKMMLFELAKSDLRLNLITFEKNRPDPQVSIDFENSGIVWTPIPFKMSGSFGGLKRVYDLQRVVGASNVLHCRSDLPSLAGILSNQGPVLWDIRSLWKEQRKQMNPSQVNAAVSLSLKSIEQYVAKNAIGMNTLTNAVVPILENRHKTLPKISSVIPTCVDLKKFAFKPFPIGKFRMLISGNLNGNYDVDRLNRFIIEIKKLTELEVVWATDVNISKIKPIHDIKVNVGHDEMPDLVASSHFGVAILQQSDFVSLTAAMPTKIAEFLAVGRPVVLNSGIGDFDHILQKRNAGLTFSPNIKLSEISIELIDLLTNQNTPRECRKIAEEFFDITIGAKQYLDIYSKLSLTERKEVL